MNLQQQIINEFGSKAAQATYIKKAEGGLWGSEEILIKKYFKSKSTVLDLGCGTGRTTIPLHKMGYGVIGVDITPAMITNAKRIAKRKKLKINYQIGDATKLAFKNNSFDNVLFSFNGWTQIPRKENRLKALQEIYRVLKPGGYFIFTAHKRTLKGYTLLWIKEWTKLYILKPLGFNIKEIEFGDRFFQLKGREKQFIHIHSSKEVKNQLSEAGFHLEYMEMSNKISTKNFPEEFPPMFYVCKK